MEKDHLEILLENMNSKFQLVLEGHAALDARMQTMQGELSEQIAQLDYKVDVLAETVGRLDKRLDGVAADLTAHRADTEAHHGVYRVKEPGV